MNSSGPYHLRWRGQTSGPYSQEAISQKLAEHEIGFWHEIGRDGEWMTLGEFLEQQERERRPPTPQQASGQREAVRRPAAKPQRIQVDVSAELTEATEDPPRRADGAFAVGVADHRARNMKFFVALGALLGFTGAHNLYAGYRGTALAQLVLTGLTLALGFGFFISWLWALIELLIVHTDAHGVRMK